MELEYKSKQGQTLFDISNIALYGMDNIVLGLLKPSGKSLIDELLIDNLIYDDSYIQDNTIQLQLSVTQASPIYKVKGQDGQSTFDLCNMNYGNLDELILLIQDNPELVSINDIDVSMKDVNFNANNLTEAYIPSIIKQKRYSFATIDKTLLSIFRILENNDYRITEDGNFRILE